MEDAIRPLSFVLCSGGVRFAYHFRDRGGDMDLGLQGFAPEGLVKIAGQGGREALLNTGGSDVMGHIRR